jgi:hypothetical protein
MRRSGLPRWLLWSHAVLCALLVFVLVLAPQHMKYETLVPPARWLAVAAVAAFLMGGAVVLIIRRGGIAQVRNATLLPIVATMIFLLGFHGKDLDLSYSARPLANKIREQAPGVKILAAQGVKRDMDYGLAFYRNEALIHYDADGVPAGEHLLVVPTNDSAGLQKWLAGRVYEPLFLYEPQGLEVYRVYPR